MTKRSLMAMVVLAGYMVTSCSAKTPLTQTLQTEPAHTSQPSPISSTIETSTQAVVADTPTITATALLATASPTLAPTRITETATAMVLETPTIDPNISDRVEPNREVAITITYFSFDPSSVVVHAGTTITWTNEDNVSHTVTADGGEFKSNVISKGSSFAFKFTKEGTFDYYCKFHGGPGGEGMSGQVIVVP